VKGARDTQQSKVYAIERATFTQVTPMTLAECQSWVDEIVSSAWWKHRSPYRRVEVRPGRGHTAWARRDYDKNGLLPTIVLPPQMRLKWVMLHELAHHLTPNSYHGSMFCANYVAIVRQVFGKAQGDTFKAYLRSKGVKVRGEAKPVVRKFECSSCHDSVGENLAWKVRMRGEAYYFCSKRCGSAWLLHKLEKVSAA